MTDLEAIDRAVGRGEAGAYLASLIVLTGAKNVVELGTGDGKSASQMMQVIPSDGILTTINWPNPPSGDNPLRYLIDWIAYPTLVLIYSDTREPRIIRQVPENIDLLYVDSTHTRACAEEELKLYSSRLANGALVVFDDLDHNDMMDFWNLLPHEKLLIWGGRGGMIRYRRGAT